MFIRTVVVSASESASLVEALNASGESAFIMGEVTDTEGVSFV